MTWEILGICHYYHSMLPKCVCTIPSSSITPLYSCPAYMHQWTRSSLVQIMACHLFGAKPLPQTTLTYCQLAPWEQSEILINIQKPLIHENAFENVICEMTAILFKERLVNCVCHLYQHKKYVLTFLLLNLFWYKWLALGKCCYKLN